MFDKPRTFARELANQFESDFPPTLQTLSGRKTIDMYSKALGRLKTRAGEVQRIERYGIVARIVLARSFQSAMQEKSYHADVLRQSTSELASALTFA
jgi:hypothetical protein